MGGRGASSGMSAKGKPYGTEYHTVLTAGRVKFIKQNDATSIRTPMETMTRGRVYVLIGKNDEPRAVTYYDNANKRYKQIDIKGRPHKIDNEYVLPHTHRGYWHDENGTNRLTAREKRSVDRIVSYWYHHK